MSLAVAQGGGAGGGGGARGGFQGRRGGGASELSLSMRADVQKELAVTDDQKTKLQALQDSMRQNRGGGAGGGGGAAGGGTPPDPAEMRKRMAQMQAEQHTALAAILNAAQMTRLHELLLQRAGYGALTMDDVQTALGLSDDQKKQITDLADKNRADNTALMQKVRDQELTREEATDMRQKNQKAFTDALQKVLTSDQDAKFKAMQGKTFTFETGNGG